MKATLSFDLSDALDAEAHRDALHGASLRAIVADLDAWCRTKLRYNDSAPQAYLDAISDVRNELHCLLDAEGLKI